MGEASGWEPMPPIPCPKLLKGFESKGLKKSITEPRFFVSDDAVIVHYSRLALEITRGRMDGCSGRENLLYSG
jgi:hypothetical protein